MAQNDDTIGSMALSALGTPTAGTTPIIAVMMRGS
jgi:hypothetical protein